VRSGLHPVQAQLARSHGSQCGFCTPGFVMSMYSLLRSSEEPPSEEAIEDALGGNLWCVLCCLLCQHPIAISPNCVTIRLVRVTITSSGYNLAEHHQPIMLEMQRRKTFLNMKRSHCFLLSSIQAAASPLHP
jgi:hypothetical protein